MSSSTVLKTARTYLVDLAERTAMTFVQATLGGIVITQVTDTTMWYAALAGGVGAVLALLKGLVATGVGDSKSASTAPRV